MKTLDNTIEMNYSYFVELLDKAIDSNENVHSYNTDVRSEYATATIELESLMDIEVSLYPMGAQVYVEALEDEFTYVMDGTYTFEEELVAEIVKFINATED